MVMRTLVDTRRLDAALEYRSMSDLLKDFRQYLEKDAGTPVERIETSAALFLFDLCRFLNLGVAQQVKVLGKSATSFVKSELDARVTIPTVQ